MTNEIYKPLYTSNKRYFFLTGGRASMKSSEAHEFAARLTYEQGNGILFTRYTMASAEKSVIPEFKIVVERLGITDHFDITKNKITNKHTGSFIIFSGIKTNSGDQTANLKSIAGITTWIIDEGEDFNDEKTFDKIDDSIRTKGKQNRVIWIQNPSTKEHFIYKRWLENNPRQIQIEGYNVTVSSHKDVEHIHSYYMIAQDYLSGSWLEKAYKHRDEALKSEDKYNTHYYYNYIGGWLERAEGAIYRDWEVGTFDVSIPYQFGLDFGYSNDPDALVKVAIDQKKKVIYAHECMYNSGQSTEVLRTRLREFCNKNDLIIADSAEGRLINDLRDEFNIKPVIKKPGSVIENIKLIQGYNLVITDESINLIKELKNYAWHDKKSGTPIDKHNHLLDAMRYVFMSLNRKKMAVA